MSIHNLLFRRKSIYPLVTFRVLFGALTAFGTARFWYYGWIEKLYLEPTFNFKFYGFEWVQMPGETAIYALHALIIAAALGIMFGLFYRLSALLFFLTFTYVELIDATNYLNHYYLVCWLALLLVFLPAGRAVSLDVLRKPAKALQIVPAWCINVLIFQLCCVYFFAGLAKINYEWLFRAMPMAIWLPERTDTPLIGYFFQFRWVAFAFAWAGMLYDLTIWFFLLQKKTQTIAYFFVVIFHVLTKVLFNIGLFPVIMIFSTLIFFSGEKHEYWWRKILNVFPEKTRAKLTGESVIIAEKAAPKINQRVVAVLSLFVLFQVVFPLRHLAYSGNNLWTEEAYRFGWRVMLVEKSGNITFYVKDSASPKKQEIVNGSHLTFYQEKQMAIQPDFILQFAHFLAEEYREKHGFVNPIVTADAYVAMNGKASRRYIDPNVNLAEIKDSFAERVWVLR